MSLLQTLSVQFSHLDYMALSWTELFPSLVIAPASTRSAVSVPSWYFQNTSSILHAADRKITSPVISRVCMQIKNSFVGFYHRNHQRVCLRQTHSALSPGPSTQPVPFASNHHPLPENQAKLKLHAVDEFSKENLCPREGGTVVG